MSIFLQIPVHDRFVLYKFPNSKLHFLSLRTLACFDLVTLGFWLATTARGVLTPEVASGASVLLRLTAQGVLDGVVFTGEVLGLSDLFGVAVRSDDRR